MISKNDDELLNIAAVAAPSYCNGPGSRVTVWVQGCTIGCRGCFNPELQPHVPKHLVDPIVFAHSIATEADRHRCEGITISGGEPLQQARALGAFCYEIKRSGLSLVLSTGYRKDALLASKSSHVMNVLSSIDILISGPYNSSNKQVRTWFLDDDKEITFMTDRYDEEVVQEGANSELLVNDGKIVTTGFIDLAHM